MSQQDASAIRPYRGLVFDTRALAVSKLGCTNLIFVEPGAKLNGQYYRNVLLIQKLLPAIHSNVGDAFVFQQDNVPTHRARDTVELLRSETPQFISPDIVTIVLTSTHRVWGMVQERVYRVPIRDTDELYGSLLFRHGPIFRRAWWTMQLISSEKRLEACIRAEGDHL